MPSRAITTPPNRSRFCVSVGAYMEPAYRLTMKQNDWITPSQFAQQLNLSQRTIIAWIKAGWILHVQLPNGRRLIPLTELERLTTCKGEPRP